MLSIMQDSLPSGFTRENRHIPNMIPPAREEKRRYCMGMLGGWPMIPSANGEEARGGAFVQPEHVIRSAMCRRQPRGADKTASAKPARADCRKAAK